MKLAVQVKLLPTPDQAAALQTALRARNTAGRGVAVATRQTETYRNDDLRKQVCTGIKVDHVLGTQAAQHVIKKAANAYATLTANLTAGNYGKPGSKRRRRVETNPVRFRWDAAQPYHARMLSWPGRRPNRLRLDHGGPAVGRRLHRVRRPAQGRRHQQDRRVGSGPPGVQSTARTRHHPAPSRGLIRKLAHSRAGG